MRHLLLFTLVLGLAACETEVKKVDSCGDGFTDEGEDCDNTVGDTTCQNLGYYGGTLGCTAQCTFDIANCEAEGRCGDAVLQTAQEECDAAELGGATCSSLGYYGGVLACGADCQFDTTDCTLAGNCGDGVVQGEQEECDGDDLTIMRWDNSESAIC